MTNTDDRPTIQERYSRATQSSHLEVIERRTGDVDILIAAGWVGDSLGTLLYRLVAEWDAVKGERTLYEQEVTRLQELHRESTAHRDREQAQIKFGPTRWTIYREQTDQHAKDIAREIVTGRAMVLMNLKTLAPAREALGRFGIQHAAAKGYPIATPALFAVVGRVLDVFLDPLCGHCAGRGFNRAKGDSDAIVVDRDRKGLMVLCRPCKGSGKRSDDDIGKDAIERQFAGNLLFEMASKMTNVERSMRSFLRTSGI